MKSIIYSKLFINRQVKKKNEIKKTTTQKQNKKKQSVSNKTNYQIAQLFSQHQFDANTCHNSTCIAAESTPRS